MAYGVIAVIPASTHTEKTFSGQGGGDSYPAIKVLNPNDGVVYVSRNRDCLSVGLGDWDWKVPSQSYAMLPGPFSSFGMFYLDQSGAGRQGEITVYPSQQKLDDPIFLAIGRALQAQATALDITQGAQPANPANGITRLWSDVQGFLHRLVNTGADAEMLDTANYGGLVTNLNGPSLSIAGDAAHGAIKLPNSAGGQMAVLTNDNIVGYYVQDRISIASGASTQILTGIAAPFALVLVTDASTAACAWFLLQGVAHSVVLSTTIGGTWSNVNGTGNSVNVFWNATQYLLQNQIVGAAHIFSVHAWLL